VTFQPMLDDARRAVRWGVKGWVAGRNVAGAIVAEIPTLSTAYRASLEGVMSVYLAVVGIVWISLVGWSACHI